MSIVYFENDFVSEEAARIPISDRGFQFGDGAFATIQVRDGVAFFLEEHLVQLQKQCLAFQITMPQVTAETIEELIRLNDAYQGIWRMKILVTGGDSGVVGLPEREGRVVIFIHPFAPQPFKALNIGIFPIPYYSCHASFKSLAHLNRFYVMEEAHRQGVDDCVTVTENGIILEAAFGNLFWVKEKTFMTPEPTLPLYYGITIKNMVRLAEKLGFEIHYCRLTSDTLQQDSSAFRTNTMQGVRPVAQIGAKNFKRNSILENLFIEGYENLLREQVNNSRLKAKALLSAFRQQHAGGLLHR